MAPVHDALSVPEILEEIILNLPLRQIVKMRSLCRETCRIIDETITIQKALFLQPVSNESLLWHIPSKRATRRGTGVEAWRADGVAENPTRYLILNPFFPIAPFVTSLARGLYNRQWYEPKIGGLVLNVGETVAYIDATPGSQHILLSFPNSFFYQHRFNGLYKNMLLTQPPMKDLNLRTPENKIEITGFCKGNLTICKLIKGFLAKSEVNYGAYSEVIEFQGGHKFALLAKTVDEITGYEMLEILASDPDKLDPNLFIKDDASGAPTFSRDGIP